MSSTTGPSASETGACSLTLTSAARVGLTGVLGPESLTALGRGGLLGPAT